MVNICGKFKVVSIFFADFSKQEEHIFVFCFLSTILGLISGTSVTAMLCMVSSEAQHCSGFPPEMASSKVAFLDQNNKDMLNSLIYTLAIERCSLARSFTRG